MTSKAKYSRILFPAIVMFVLFLFSNILLIESRSIVLSKENIQSHIQYTEPGEILIHSQYSIEQFQPDALISLNFPISIIQINNQRNLKSLPHQFFSSNRKVQQSLRKIVLFNNTLQHLPESIFHNLSNLTHLNLSNNQIKHLNKNIFSTNVKLTVIHLSSNPLSHIPEGIFRNNLKLKELNLDFLNLTSLPDHLLNSNGSVIIDLSHNRLTYIQDRVFQNVNLAKAIVKLEGNLLFCLSERFLRNEARDIDLGMNCFNELEEICKLYECKRQNRPECARQDAHEKKRINMATCDLDNQILAKMRNRQIPENVDHLKDFPIWLPIVFGVVFIAIVALVLFLLYLIKKNKLPKSCYVLINFCRKTTGIGLNIDKAPADYLNLTGMDAMYAESSHDEHDEHVTDEEGPDKWSEKLKSLDIENAILK